MQKILRIHTALLTAVILVLPACRQAEEKGESRAEAPFVWENANIYFLLTDRFRNGDPSNDTNFNRTDETATLRGFEGGDIRGVIETINEGYFDSLGITAIWLTPFFEQIHGSTDEGTGRTYGYHGYWTKDWTSLDPNFGTEADLSELVSTAHRHGIRVVMDVIMNHTGPVTGRDPVWPDDWVRTGPPCEYRSYETTVCCTLVENLPDIRTGSMEPVDLPPQLIRKWEEEGRLEKELAELEAFFLSTGYPRAPRYYLIKWLTDFVRRYGIDGYRLDTAKHIDEEAWAELWEEAQKAFLEWKDQNPEAALDQNNFFMVGEVYGYGISAGREYDFGDRKVDYYAHAVQSLINFDFKYDADKPCEELFSTYSDLLHSTLEGNSVLNYISSHDDGDPFDRERQRPIEAGTKLLLCPGASQIYYGDETCRRLDMPARGDAALRGNMNWDELGTGSSRNGFPVDSVLAHFRKLGQFRRDHPSVGAGIHRMVSRDPYLFTRSFSREGYSDHVLVGIGLEKGSITLDVSEVFEEGCTVRDYYTNQEATVRNGTIGLENRGIVLLGEHSRDNLHE